MLTKDSAAVTKDHGERTWWSGVKSECTGVTETGLYKPVCLNTWSPVNGSCGEEQGGMALLKEMYVSLNVSLLRFQNPPTITSVLFAFYLQIKK